MSHAVTMLSCKLFFTHTDTLPLQIDHLDDRTDTWLQTLYENGVNGILADEMGLGKTVQCVAMLSHMVYMGVPGPFLICAPLSTLPNWYNEFQRFSPKVSDEKGLGSGPEWYISSML